MALCTFSSLGPSHSPGLGLSLPFCGEESLGCVWGALLLNGAVSLCGGRPWLRIAASGVLLWAVFPFCSYCAPGLVPGVVGIARGSQTGNVP